MSKMTITVETDEDLSAQDQRDLLRMIAEEISVSFGKDAAGRLGYEGPYVTSVDTGETTERPTGGDPAKVLLTVDAFGRRWHLRRDERCVQCGQPIPPGGCDHKKLSNEQAMSLGATEGI